MQRPIKFRGKRVDNGEWIYGDLIINSIIDPFTYIAKGIGYKVDDPEIGKPIKVLPDTVGQYTGLKDKNGKDVYEGDVVRFEVENPDMWNGATRGEVYFEETEACFAIKNKGQSYVTIGHGYDAYPGRLEIVGNVYEN